MYLGHLVDKLAHSVLLYEDVIDLAVNDPWVIACCPPGCTVKLVWITHSVKNINMVLLLMYKFGDGSILRGKKGFKH